MLRIPALVPI
ncbi:uncharacterized protein FFNC_15705 [Fusarium fujikuroi]|nr:uncharacterized protein FFNC_15705 [Fusarium fujikuroi]